MDSVEVELRIFGLSERRYQASILKSPFGSPSQSFQVPVGWPHAAEATESEDRDVRRRRESRRDKARLDAILRRGRELFDFVFAGEVRAAFVRSLELAKEKKLWFRLRLSFDNATEAAAWPWETLVAEGSRPLACRSKVSIERRPLSRRALASPQLCPDRPLRILVAGASPPDLPGLNVRKESDRIRRAFGKTKVEIETRQNLSRADLEKASAAEVSFDVLHFMGHGDFDGEDGGIWLVGEGQQGDRLSSRELPAFFEDPVSFVYLNACHSGRSSRDPFDGLAEALLDSGVAAVLAMRSPISDEGAIKLARSFYQRVAEGETLVHALAMVRCKASLNECDWAVPTLFLPGDDFALLPSAPEPEKAEPNSQMRSFLVHGPARSPEFGGWRAWVPFSILIGILLLVLVLWLTPNAELGESRFSSILPSPPAVPAESRCPSPKHLDLAFVFIPEGSFVQGVDRGSGDEKPPPVTLTHDFCIGAFEVTRALYAAVMGNDPPGPGDAYLPQGGVNREKVQQFLQTLNLREPEAGYRLPTEAEWEYAARAGTTTDYSFGDDPAALPQYANCLSRESNDRFDSEAPVGSFAANAWGLYDMQGNLWEWTADSFSDYFAAAVTDPRSPAMSSDKKVRRGGAYDSAPKNCRPTTRSTIDPTWNYKNTGFRLVRTSVR